jgi:hypothetical protein
MCSMCRFLLSIILHVLFHHLITILQVYVPEYLCHKWSRIWSTCLKHFPVLSSFVIHDRDCNYSNTTSALPTLLEHPSSPLVFSGVRVTRSLAFCVVLVVLMSFFIWHCVVFPSIYGFWLPPWYLLTIPTARAVFVNHSNIIQKYHDNRKKDIFSI